MTTPTSGPSSTGGTPSSNETGPPPPSSSGGFKVTSTDIMGMSMTEEQAKQFYNSLMMTINAQIQQEQARMITAIDLMNPEKNPDLQQ